MKTLRSALLAVSFGFLSATAMAADITAGNVWVRGTVPGQKATGAFMEVTSKSGAALVGVSSPVAGIAEIHEMKMADGVMQMRAIPRLELPAGQPVKLAPGGYHVMLMDLKQALQAGEIVPLILSVEGKDKKTETVQIQAEVRDLTAKPVSGGSAKH